MSVVLTLTSCAVIAGLTMTNTALMSVLVHEKGEQEEVSEGYETPYVDGEILAQTLQGFDCHFKQINENCFSVQTTCGNIIYKRENVGEAFKLYFDEIDDVEGLIANIQSFEADYGRNVQAYTFAHIRENLSDNMSIVENEVLEDDSLYLTINVE